LTAAVIQTVELAGALDAACAAVVKGCWKLPSWLLPGFK
jgi:hypothetical protein